MPRSEFLPDLPILAITRRVGESVLIGDPAKPTGELRIVDIHGDKVRLAFSFPRDTPVNRAELAVAKAKGGTASNG